jgi:mannose-1-phosphate guanylyltransferase/mannose-6-phosphate isomerase
VVLAVLPSDHRIKEASAFRKLVQRAALVAASGYIVTFGIAPTRAATEFGYIERGDALLGHDGAFAVARFREKPDAETARNYLASGNFDWNSGMFFFSARTFREEGERHMKDIWDDARQAVLRGQAREGALDLDPEAFAAVRKTSIDYALLEKSQRVAVLPAAFDWSDVGNWSTVHEALAADDQGNVFQGDVKGLDCDGTLVISEDIPVRVLGLDGIAVVVTKAGVLVSRLDHAARIKDVLD